jgi:hypothetical protein
MKIGGSCSDGWKMKTERTKPVEILGFYVLPGTGAVAAEARPTFVILHLGLPQVSGAERRTQRSTTTAIALLGKRDVIKTGPGTHPQHQLLMLSGASQPTSMKGKE